MKFCWSTLNVKDMDETVKFYEDIIGLKVNQRFKPREDMEIVFMGEGETQVEFIYSKNQMNVQIGPDISWGFIVESVDEMMKVLKEHEIEITDGPFQPNPKSKFIYVKDPNGLKIQFFEYVK
jgi:lactoylglutathione lyase